MVDRTIIFGEAGRASVRGLTQIAEAKFLTHQRDDDNLTYVWDFAGFLGSETISSVAREGSGVTAAGTSNTTTTMTQRLTGQGYMDFKIVTSGSQTKQFRVVIAPRSEDTDDLTDRYPD